MSEQLEKLLLAPLRSWRKSSQISDNVILFLDALDECDDDTKMLRFLNLLVKNPGLSAMGVRVIVTSRPEAVDGSVKEPESVTYEHKQLLLYGISRQTLDADIRTFLLHELGQIKQSRSVPRILST
jgi:hypothetical protein